jgi:hypothetical protein
MKAEINRFGRSASIIAVPLLATAVAFTGLGLSGDVVMAQQRKQPEKWTEEFKRHEHFDRNNFDPDGSTKIDNKFHPIKPGTQWVWRGWTQDGKKRIPHRVVMTVTDLTKVIDGVRTVVVWDVDYQAEKLSETELIFFAQDKQGNVWHFGQYNEYYDEEGGFKGGKTHFAGSAGARAGIIMQAEPRPGTPSYSQGYSPPPKVFTDRAKVEQVGQKTCVPAGCYQDVLVTSEISELEGPEAEQLKYYAPGVGGVRIGWRGSQEKTKETLELTEMRTLDPEAMARVRAEAMALETRAAVYGREPPAERMRGSE